MSDHPESTVTLSVRVNSKQAEDIRVAASAANMFVSEYINRRVVDKPILSNPALAALAELIATLRRLEVAPDKDGQSIELLREEIHRLCGAVSNQSTFR